jgi:putative transposase
VEVIVDFIDANRDELGVEPICRDLQVAPSTYYAARSRAPSARDRRDAALIPLLVAIWEANFRVYGVRKLWKAARRAGHDVGRDQVARLMGLAGIEGLRRGKKRKTTKVDPAAERHPDLVKAGLFRRAPERLVGVGPDLCGDLVGLRLRILHH